MTPRCFTRTCGACASANNGPVDDAGRRRLEAAWLASQPYELVELEPDDESR